MLHKTEYVIPDGFIFPQDMQQFGPEPFTAVNAAHELQIVHRIFCCMFIYFFCFTGGRMIFPQYKQGIGIVFQPR